VIDAPAAPSITEATLAAARRRWARSVLGGAVVVGAIVICLAYTGLFDRTRLSEGIPDLFDVIAEGLPPDFGRLGSWVSPMLDTLAMSVAGTSLAVAASLPISLLAARNTSPHPAVYRAARLVLNALRSVPEVILGIIFVAAVGFGSLPGVLALGIHSIGMVGKFFAESIEHVDEAPVEAVRASGAAPGQVLLNGVLPQVIPQMADVAVYRWEYNFRASTVLGLVGAGGIGFELLAALRVLEYREVSALLIVVLATVTVVDAIGGRLRRHFR
jgi:phosphonate transport system permease protein